MGNPGSGFLCPHRNSLMKYRNTKTGNVIDIKGKLSGGDWEAVNGRPPKTSLPKKQVVSGKDG